VSKNQNGNQIWKIFMNRVFVNLIFSFFIVFGLLSSDTFAEAHHHDIKTARIHDNSYQWELRKINPFDELLISWNSRRPIKGHYAIYVSVDTGDWSPWLPYAEWGSDFQKSFSSKEEGFPVSTYQDCVQVSSGKGTGFRIKVVAMNGADLSELQSLHVCSSNPSLIRKQDAFYSRPKTFLNVAGLSQMALNDSRNGSLCSPTSTTAVVRYINNDAFLDPIEFAECCWDSGFDMFGNWVFNVAEAYNRLVGSRYTCWVERYESFQRVIDSLERGSPSVISVRGPLPGSAQPYKSGHLVAVIGFDGDNQEVICMDPAFPSDAETIVKYKLNDLLKAWERRKNVVYVFQKISD